MEYSGYQSSTLGKHLQKSGEMDIAKQTVFMSRQRYLTEELERVELEMAWYDDFEGAVDSEYFALRQYAFLGAARAKILLELCRIKKAMTTKQDEITEDIIAAAKSHPMTSIIEFTRGKAKAFCHEDNNPSMYHATRLNLAICPVCDKRFDTIAVLMERDGMSFQDAVRALI
jgi:hypothetical protein